ncbi:MAG: PAS domain S-box protein, partial [Halobacteriota archaeon]|nr:PAS domain S-box protein [Halobacteriota archaeon]
MEISTYEDYGDSELKMVIQRVIKNLDLDSTILVATYPNKKISFVNDHFTEVLGYEEAEVLGKDLSDLSSFDGRKRFNKSLFQRKDLKMVLISWQCIPILGKSDEKIGLLLSGIEETDKKISDEIYSKVVERANDAIFIIQDGIFKFANQKMADFSKYMVEELVGMDFQKLITPESVDIVAERVRKRLAGEIVENFYEVELLDKEGHVLPIEVNAGLIDYEGRPADLVFLRDISERKKMEVSLRESELKYSTVVEGSNDGIIVLDNKMCIAYANKTILDLLGYTTEAIGSNVLKYIKIEPNRLVDLMGNFRQRMAGEDVTSTFEIDLLCKNGNIIPAEVSIGKIDFKSKPADVIFIRDISERKRAEEAIKAEKEKYQDVVENIEEGLFTLDRYGKFIYLNQEMVENITGYTSGELIGTHISALVSKRRKIDILPTFSMLLKGNKICNVETEIKKKDDTFVPIIATVTPKIEDGKVTKIFGVVRDISERKHFEKSIEDAHKQLKNIFDSVDVVLFSNDIVKSRILEVSPSCEKLYGYTPEEFIENPMIWRDTIHPDDRKSISELIIKMFSGKSLGAEYRIIRSDGEIRWVYLNLKPILDNSNSLIRVDGVVSDITERKKIEVEKGELLEDLERSNKELEQFAYVASHDLQEPLRMVSSYLTLLSRRYKGKLDSDADDFIHFAVDGATRMQRMINDLLTYSRVGTKGKPLEETDCEVLLKDALSNL